MGTVRIGAAIGFALVDIAGASDQKKGYSSDTFELRSGIVFASLWAPGESFPIASGSTKRYREQYPRQAGEGRIRTIRTLSGTLADHQKGFHVFNSFHKCLKIRLDLSSFSKVLIVCVIFTGST